MKYHKDIIVYEHEVERKKLFPAIYIWRNTRQNFIFMSCAIVTYVCVYKCISLLYPDFFLIFPVLHNL